MNEEKIIITKKRKNDNKKVEKAIKNDNISQNYCDFDKSGVMLFAWVKTLLSIHDAIPNIIKIIDKIITTKATSAIDGSAIFGDYKHGTYNQIEQVIDLQERKLSLINIYTIIETMVSVLSKKQKEFVRLKFYKHKTVQYIAEELEIDERTAFRWSNNILSKLVNYCESNNWSVMFFNSQTKDEPWIKDHFSKYYKRMIEYNKV